jgi:hypothetical protein
VYETTRIPVNCQIILFLWKACILLILLILATQSAADRTLRQNHRVDTKSKTRKSSSPSLLASNRVLVTPHHPSSNHQLKHPTITHARILPRHARARQARQRTAGSRHSPRDFHPPCASSRASRRSLRKKANKTAHRTASLIEWPYPSAYP